MKIHNMIEDSEEECVYITLDQFDMLVREGRGKMKYQEASEADIELSRKYPSCISVYKGKAICVSKI